VVRHTAEDHRPTFVERGIELELRAPGGAIYVDGDGARLSQVMRWNRVEDLVAGYIADVSASSGGLIRYHIVGRHIVDEFPVKADGFRYTPKSYLDVARHGAPDRAAVRDAAVRRARARMEPARAP
jgi:hypothetical protein